MLTSSVKCLFRILLASCLLCLAIGSLPRAALAAKSSNNPDDPAGKEIYIVSPSCGSYKCQVTWARGSSQQITWWNAPKGGLKIQLVPQDGSSGSTYTVTDKVGSIHSEASCKASAPKGESCGTYSWTVPADVKLGKYTVSASSIANSKKVGYADTVVITKKKSKRDPLA